MKTKIKFLVFLFVLSTTTLLAFMPTGDLYWEAVEKAAKSKNWEKALRGYMSNVAEVEAWQDFNNKVRESMDEHLIDIHATRFLPIECYSSDDTKTDWVSYLLMLGRDNFELFLNLDSTNMNRLVNSNKQHYCPGWLETNSEGFIWGTLQHIEDDLRGEL